MILEVRNDNGPDSDKGSVFDRDQMRKACFQNHVITDKNVLPDVDSPGTLQEHTDAQTAWREHGQGLKDSVNEPPEWIFPHGSMRNILRHRQRASKSSTRFAEHA